LTDLLGLHYTGLGLLVSTTQQRHVIPSKHPTSPVIIDNLELYAMHQSVINTNAASEISIISLQM
jgi:hypothetical protein